MKRGEMYKVKHHLSQHVQDAMTKYHSLGFPGGSVVKNPPANAGDAGSIRRVERSPGEGSGNPLQYFCLGNPMDRGAWRAKSRRLQKNRTQLKD